MQRALFLQSRILHSVHHITFPVSMQLLSTYQDQHAAAESLAQCISRAERAACEDQTEVECWHRQF